MNEKIAKKTIEDHKYLLEHVDNRAAIAYFAVANRNLCLFQALKSFLDQKKIDDEAAAAKENEEKEKGEGETDGKTPPKKVVGGKNNKKNLMENDPKYKKMEEMFHTMLYKTDFMTLIMYPALD